MCVPPNEMEAAVDADGNTIADFCVRSTFMLPCGTKSMLPLPPLLGVVDPLCCMPIDAAAAASMAPTPSDPLAGTAVVDENGVAGVATSVAAMLS